MLCMTFLDIRAYQRPQFEYLHQNCSTDHKDAVKQYHHAAEANYETFFGTPLICKGGTSNLH